MNIMNKLRYGTTKKLLQLFTATTFLTSVASCTKEDEPQPERVPVDMHHVGNVVLNLDNNGQVEQICFPEAVVYGNGVQEFPAGLGTSLQVCLSNYSGPYSKIEYKPGSNYNLVSASDTAYKSNHGWTYSKHGATPDTLIEYQWNADGSAIGVEKHILTPMLYGQNAYLSTTGMALARGDSTGYHPNVSQDANNINNALHQVQGQDQAHGTKFFRLTQTTPLADPLPPNSPPPPSVVTTIHQANNVVLNMNATNAAAEQIAFPAAIIHNTNSLDYPQGLGVTYSRFSGLGPYTIMSWKAGSSSNLVNNATDTAYKVMYGYMDKKTSLTSDTIVFSNYDANNTLISIDKYAIASMPAGQDPTLATSGLIERRSTNPDGYLPTSYMDWQNINASFNGLKNTHLSLSQSFSAFSDSLPSNVVQPTVPVTVIAKGNLGFDRNIVGDSLAFYFPSVITNTYDSAHAHVDIDFPNNLGESYITTYASANDYYTLNYKHVGSTNVSSLPYNSSNPLGRLTDNAGYIYAITPPNGAACDTLVAEHFINGALADITKYAFNQSTTDVTTPQGKLAVLSGFYGSFDERALPDSLHQGAGPTIQGAATTTNAGLTVLMNGMRFTHRP